MAGDGLAAARALKRLRELHIAMARVELPQVHPTWLIRALQDESPAVQRLVSDSVPEPLKHSLQAGLLLDAQDIASDHAVQPMFREWVMGLWTERLLGGEPSRSDDSPALAAVCRLGGPSGYRLCRMAGIGKMVLATDKPGKAFQSPVRRSRAEWLHGRLSNLGSEFRGAQRRTEVQSVAASKVPKRHHAARIGLFTLARLLADAEPSRLRWALQHWPYKIVKLLRVSMTTSSTTSTPAILACETELLLTAWERLKLEGRLATQWPQNHAVSDRERLIT